MIFLLVYRRLLADDDFGVVEALSESPFDSKGLVVRGTHKVFLGKKEVCY